MSIINNGLLLASGADAATTYQISRSIRLNAPDSAYFSRTPSSAGNRRTWTFSCWIKRAKLGEFTSIIVCMDSGASHYFQFVFETDDTLSVYDTNVAGSTKALQTSRVFRDVSAWYHLVLYYNTTQSTAANKAKLYVNGVEETAFSTDNRSSLTADSSMNRAEQHSIGSRQPYSGSYLNAYLADIYFLDGTATDPSTFGQTDAVTGQWVPKTPTGISYGTNGFRLSFSDNSGTTSTTLGKDAAGSNNWTPNNFSVASGSGNDSLVDSPTSYGTDTGAGSEVRGNYCTLNPLWCNSAITLSNGNLDLSSTSTAWKSVSSTIAMPTSGKWYFEVLQTVATDYLSVGVAPVGFTLSNHPGSTATSWAWQSHANKWNNNTGTSWGSTTTNGDIIMIAVDRDSGKIWAGKNGTWFSSGNPASGTNEMFSGLGSELLVPAIGAYSTTSCAMNFGARAFSYQAPSGFKALCDTNLPAPVVAKPNTVMGIVQYTGNSSTQTITGLDFNPDLIWSKSRSGTFGHGLFDSVRGVSRALASHSTDAEGVGAAGTGVTAFNSNGFSLGPDSGAFTGYINYTGSSQVAWCWDAGSSTVTNGSGSITSSVRANASAGFSICTFSTTTASGINTFGHGLNASPQFAIIKPRNVTQNWAVFHNNSNANPLRARLQLNLTDAANTYGIDVWSRSSTTLGVDTTILAAPGTAIDCVAYVFAPVAGYSSFGSYTGNGSTDGPFVYTGFKVKWLMIKRTDSTSNWYMIDASRSPYNEVNDLLYAEQSLAETVDDGNNGIDFLSNGFKLRKGVGGTNVNGSTLIYAAFAENPFAYARAR